MFIDKMSRITSSRRAPPTQARPMSSSKGAGFTSSGLLTSGGSNVVNPLDRDIALSQIQKSKEKESENVIKKYKVDVMNLIQQF
jgi:hypothetical protein